MTELEAIVSCAIIKPIIAWYRDDHLIYPHGKILGGISKEKHANHVNDFYIEFKLSDGHHKYKDLPSIILNESNRIVLVDSEKDKDFIVMPVNTIVMNEKGEIGVSVENTPVSDLQWYTKSIDIKDFIN